MSNKTPEASDEYAVLLEATVIAVKLGIKLKALVAIVLTLEGIVIDVNTEDWNAFSPIVVSSEVPVKVIDDKLNV